MCVLVGSGVVEAYAGHSQQMLCLTCKDERKRESERLWRGCGEMKEEEERKEEERKGGAEGVKR